MEQLPGNSWLEGRAQFLNTGLLLSFFSEHTESARDIYLRFIYQGIGIVEEKKAEKRSVSRIQDAKNLETKNSLIASNIERPSLSEIFAGAENRQERNLRICRANLKYGYSLREIGESLDMKASAISMMLKRLDKKCEVKSEGA